MKMAHLFVAAIGLAAMSGSMAADVGRKLKYDYVPSCYQPQTLLACGAQPGLECYDAGGSDASCSNYYCCTPPAGGRKLAQVSVAGVDASNYQAVADSYTNAAQAIADSYQGAGQNYENAGQPYEDAAQATAANYQSYAPPRVPTCYAPYSILACGAQTGLECYDAGGSDDTCSAYYCCQPAAGGRRLSQAAGSGVDTSNYEAIAEGFQNGAQFIAGGAQAIAQATSEGFQDGAAATAANYQGQSYAPPRVPTCYAPYSNLACGAQTGLECYDAGGSDDTCSAYYCCQPAAGGRKLSQVTVAGVDASNYQAVADSYTNAAQAIADSYQGAGQNYEGAGQNYEDAAQATAANYQNAGQNYEDAAQATAANYQSYAPPRVPTCYAPYSNLACGAQTGLQCYDAGGSDDTCSAYYCCQPQ